MKIIRKDGLEYERKAKDINLDTAKTIRFNSKEFETFKVVCESQNIPYGEIIRNLTNKYSKRYKQKISRR